MFSIHGQVPAIQYKRTRFLASFPLALLYKYLFLISLNILYRVTFQNVEYKIQKEKHYCLLRGVLMRKFGRMLFVEIKNRNRFGTKIMHRSLQSFFL